MTRLLDRVKALLPKRHWIYRYTGDERMVWWDKSEEAGEFITLTPGRIISKELFDALPKNETIRQRVKP